VRKAGQKQTKSTAAAAKKHIKPALKRLFRFFYAINNQHNNITKTMFFHKRAL
jgi:hypothetical protein